MTIIKGDFGGRKDEPGKKATKKEKKPIPIYQFHVSLAFSDPLIWRRILIPGDFTLEKLHRVLQVCMGWTGEYNHQFYVGKVFYNVGSSNADMGEYNEADVLLQSLEESMKWCFTYMYDAGDGWEHEIALEECLAADPERRAPLIVDGEWAAPPESIGSVHLYTELLYAIENPDEKRCQQLLKTQDITGFDPHLFDKRAMNAELEKFAKMN